MLMPCMREWPPHKCHADYCRFTRRRYAIMIFNVAITLYDADIAAAAITLLMPLMPSPPAITPL